MAADINEVLGDLLNNPMFWIIIVLVVAIILIWKFYKPHKKEFKAEPLSESLKKDLRPRMAKQGKKVKNTWLMQKYHKFGKVRKWTEGEIEYHTRKQIELKPEEVKRMSYQEKEKHPKNAEGKYIRSGLIKEIMQVVYFSVGGNTWLNAFLGWIPFLKNKFEPDYYVINKDFVEHHPDKKIFEVSFNAHIYPYGTIWISDKKTQNYMTELEARRTMEFEAETNINTLNRWTFYDSDKAGQVMLRKTDAQLEQAKWDSAKDRGSDS